MRKFLLAAVAAAAIASPAAARDGSGYVGVDLGAMLAEDTKLDFDDGVTQINNAVSTDYNAGFDIGFVNAELARLGQPPVEHGRVVDTLALARRKQPMGPNSLDSLCRRYGIDNSRRLIAEALASVG